MHLEIFGIIALVQIQLYNQLEKNTILSKMQIARPYKKCALTLGLAWLKDRTRLSAGSFIQLSTLSIPDEDVNRIKIASRYTAPSNWQRIHV